MVPIMKNIISTPVSGDGTITCSGVRRCPGKVASNVKSRLLKPAAPKNASFTAAGQPALKLKLVKAARALRLLKTGKTPKRRWTTERAASGCWPGWKTLFMFLIWQPLLGRGVESRRGICRCMRSKMYCVLRQTTLFIRRGTSGHMEKMSRSAFGFRNSENYRLRVLVHCG
jgi:hypothetical protein